MITRKLEAWEKAEIFYKTETQKEVNNWYFNCEWDKITDYFLGKDGEVVKSPLYKICRHFFLSNVKKFPSLWYWSVDDYFQTCALNFHLTCKKEQESKGIEIERISSEELYHTYYTNLEELDFYSSILAHCKYILLEYVAMTKRDKNRINYSSDSLEYLQETCGDGLNFMTLKDASWSPEKIEEEKTKSKRGRKKGSKNKSK